MGRERVRRGIAAPFTCKVRGVTFAPAYPDNLARLEAVAARAYLTPATAAVGDPEPLPAILVREPANPVDPAAVAVHVPALGDLAPVGHLPAAVAARLAPELDSGTAWSAEVYEVLVHPDHPDRPGISLRCERLPA